MRTLFLLLASAIALTSFGQYTFKGKVYSFIDRKPLPNFLFRVDKAHVAQTDSLGVFTIEAKSRRIRLSTIFKLYGFDTTVNQANSDRIELFAVKEYDSTMAAYEIEHNAVRLFCGISFAPRELTEADREFEKQFNLSYYIVGDFLPCSSYSMRAYNKVVVEYLDRKYGADWRKDLRQDVWGVTDKRSR